MKKSIKVVQANISLAEFRKTAEAILLSRYAPASVVVNDQMNIVHIHGIINPFLEFSPEKPAYNIFKIAHEDLVSELRSALFTAKLNNSKVIREGIALRINGQRQLINIEIIPFVDILEPYFLIVF